MKPTASIMSMVFEARPLLSQSFMQRLLGQHPSQNAVIELNNLLASRPIESITSADLTAIETRYGLSLGEYRLNLEEFYAVHLKAKLADLPLGPDDVAELTHLVTLFQLPAQSIEQLHVWIGEDVYRQRVKQALEQGHLTEADKATLVVLGQSISLPTELIDQIYRDACQARFDEFLQVVGADARITPQEASQLQLMGQQLGVKPSAETTRTIERYWRYWAIDHTPLPVLEVALPLQKSEVCYFRADGVQWFEERATIRRTNNTDHYEQHKSFDVINLESNQVSVQKDTFTILKRIQVGNLYITNKRLLFESQEKTSSIKLDVIVAIKPYRQGVLIDKLTGKNMLLLINRDADNLALIYRRLVHASPGS